MVYGTTARHSWGFSSGFSPAPVWKLWKDFGIEGSQMIGYWDDTCPVKTNHPDVKATVYIRPEKVLISVGNFDTQDHSVRLLIDWEKLGLDPSKVTLEAPKIENFQEKTVFAVNEPIPVKSKEGWLFIIQRQ